MRANAERYLGVQKLDTLKPDWEYRWQTEIRERLMEK